MSFRWKTRQLFAEEKPVLEEENNDVPDDSMFRSTSAMTDATLLVEDKPLHVSKCVLSLASPVFRKMFEGECVEEKKIPLVDKKYNDMVELLLCVYPSTRKPITRSNLEVILPLADEYEIESMKQGCENLLLEQLQFDQRYNKPLNKELVHFLYLADKYRLKQVFDVCLEKTKRRKYEGEGGLKSFTEFDLMSIDGKFRVCSGRLSCLESCTKGFY